MKARNAIVFAEVAGCFFAVIGLACAGAGVLSLLHGAGSIGCFLDSKTVAIATTVAVLLFLSGTGFTVNFIQRHGIRPGLLAGAAAVICAWVFFVRPALQPAPLARMLPEGTAYFISLDAVNLARGLGDIGDALGRDIVRAFLYPEKAPAAPAGKGALDYLVRWAGREAVLAGRDGFYGGGRALIIGVRNKSAAAEDFPWFVNLVFGLPVRGGYHAAAPEGDVLINCTHGAPLYCLAITNRAAVVSDSEEYLRQIIATEQAPVGVNRFEAQFKRDDTGGRVVYAYLDGRFAADVFSGFARGNNALRDEADFMRGIEGVEYSLCLGGQGIRQRAAFLPARHEGQAAASRLLNSRHDARVENVVMQLLDNISAGGRAFGYERSGGLVRLSFQGGIHATLAFAGDAVAAGADDDDARNLLDNVKPAGATEFRYSSRLLRAVAVASVENQSVTSTQLARGFNIKMKRFVYVMTYAMTTGTVLVSGNGGASWMEWRQGFREDGMKRIDPAAVATLVYDYAAVASEAEETERRGECVNTMARVRKAIDSYWVDGGNMDALFSTGGVCSYLSGKRDVPGGCGKWLERFVEQGCGGGAFSFTRVGAGGYKALWKGDAGSCVTANNGDVTVRCTKGR